MVIASGRDRGQRSEVGRQKTEDRGQKSEVRSQRSEVRGQRSEGRGQRSEDRRQKGKRQRPASRPVEIIDEVLDSINKWPEFAKEAGVNPEQRKRIAGYHRTDIK